MLFALGVYEMSDAWFGTSYLVVMMHSQTQSL